MTTAAAVAFSAFPVIGGTLIAATTMTDSKRWYSTLRKPIGTPPSWVFGPVWTALYVMMGYAAYKVWAKKGDLMMFVIQLALNYAWTYLFFGLHDMRAACVDVAILLACVAYMTSSFWRIDRLAGSLIVPYVAWTAYAAYLTFALYGLNT